MGSDSGLIAVGQPAPAGGMSALGTSLAAMLTSDFDISRRPLVPASLDGLSQLASALDGVIHQKPLIFAAFDGDHQHLCAHMRRYALRRGAVPVNADSVLGYKEAVLAHGDKAAVLFDDIALLRNCDQLWVFTDIEPKLNALAGLAEGVLVELLYFLSYCRRPVSFVPICPLLSGQAVPPQPLLLSPEELRAALDPLQAQEALELVSAARENSCRLWPVAYHVVDPLDFKYSHWLRPDAFARGCLPIVPGFAVEISDVDPSLLGEVVIAWAALTRLAQTAWGFPSMHPERGEALTAALIAAVCERNGRPVSKRSWRELAIPKASAPSRWALTAKEGRLGLF